MQEKRQPENSESFVVPDEEESTLEQVKVEEKAEERDFSKKVEC